MDDCKNNPEEKGIIYIAEKMVWKIFVLLQENIKNIW